MSASYYAGHAERRVLKLQQAYLRKHQPQKFASTKAAPSGEGIADVTHGFQLGLLKHPSAPVSDDDCRDAVTRLNMFRLLRAEDLEEGYDVSNIVFYNIY